MLTVGGVEKVVKRRYRFLRSQTLAAPPPASPAPENDAYVGCRLRLLPHLEGASRGGRRRPAAALAYDPAGGVDAAATWGARG